MTARKSESLTCNVCRKQLASGEEYLVRMREGRTSTVHRHLCFPPAVSPPQTTPNTAAA
jgi:RNase P subunit RPR2